MENVILSPLYLIILLVVVVGVIVLIAWYQDCKGKRKQEILMLVDDKFESIKDTLFTAQDDFSQFVKDFGSHCKANRCYPESNYAIVEFKGSHYVGACTDHTTTDELWAILGVYPSREEAYSLILDLYIPF